MPTKKDFQFKITRKLPGSMARSGVITTPHGTIKTPAFIVVGTKATVKAMLPEQVADTGAQAVLANAYHLFLRPGHALVDEAGGLAEFMNWSGPTFTDSGGFQVMSLGVGYKKVLSMQSDTYNEEASMARKSERMAHIDDDGVTFKSHLDGKKHRFTPEKSMQIQHSLGADIMFAFDECTALLNTYTYQKESLIRTHEWAKRCVAEHERLTKLRKHKPYQALFGVVQGAQYEELRKESAQFLSSLDFDGFGLGGAFEKKQLAKIVRWMNEVLPENKPRHLLGISEPDDMFAAVEEGIDTFDCVSPTRVGRNGSLYTPDGRINILNAKYRHDFTPLSQECTCYTCLHYTKAYIHHLFRAKEMLAATLASIHNEYFIVQLVNNMRKSINKNNFFNFRDQWLARYYKK